MPSVFFLNSFIICFGAVDINDSKTIFDMVIVLKITILPSNVRFLFFHIFNTWSMSIFFPLLIFRCKKNEYLKFLMYHYLDLYNVTHRLPLEPLSGLQYP